MRTRLKDVHPFVRYRYANRPDDDMDVLDPVPIIPPKEKRKHGYHFIHDYHREVAWAIDYRGDNDDIPTLLFAGAGYTLVKKIFLMMFGQSSPLFSGFKLYRDFYIYQRQAKNWVRIAVELRNYQHNVLSLEDLGMIIARKMQQECLCNVRYLKLDKLLNV